MSLLLVSLGGCQRDAPLAQDPVAAVYSIRVEPASLVLAAGATGQLAAEATDSAGRLVGGARFSFHSTAPHLLGVSPSGAVTSVGPAGTAAIEVRSGGRAASVPVTIDAGPPARIELVDVPVATTAVGTALGTPRVRIVDAHGNPVAGAALRWRVLSGAGVVREAATHSAGDGLAGAEWLAGTSAGAQRLEVQVDGVAPLRIESTATAGPAAGLTLQLSDDDAGAAIPRLRQPLAIVASVRDAHGNGVAAAGVAIAPLPRCGLPGATVVTAADGDSPPLPWTPTVTGRCVLTARVADGAVAARLSVDVEAEPARTD